VLQPSLHKVPLSETSIHQLGWEAF